MMQTTGPVFIFALVLLLSLAQGEREQSCPSTVYIRYSVNETLPESDFFPPAPNASAVYGNGCCLYTQPENLLVCDSLDEALDRLQTLNGMVFFIGLARDTRLLHMHIVSNKMEVSMVGLNEQRVVSCLAVEPASLAMRSIVKARMENISWVGCGGGYSSLYSAAVMFQHCFNIVVRRSAFTGSPVSGLSVVVNSIANPTSILVCANNTKNCQKHMVNTFSCRIEFSSFTNNSNLQQSGSTGSKVYGGGLAVAIGSPSLHYLLAISDCHIENNFAVLGGGLSVVIDDSPLDFENCTDSLVELTNTKFIHNQAGSSGGGYYQFGGRGVISGCHFIGNIANLYSGGAQLTGMGATSSCKSALFEISNCTWTNNTAFNHAAVWFHTLIPISVLGLKLTGNTVSCNSVTSNSIDANPCVFSARTSKISFQNTMFQFNNGSGLCLYDTTAFLSERVNFTGNMAPTGGAVQLRGDSILSLSPGTHILFTNNSAFYGGAIYKGKATSSCSFDFRNPLNRTRITFFNNLAQRSGSSIFFESLTKKCQEQVKMIPPFVSHTDSSQFGTSATTVDLLPPIKKINGTNNQYKLDIRLGEHLLFNNATVKDMFGSATTVLVFVALQPSNGHYSLNGQTAFFLQNGSSTRADQSLYLTGPVVSDSVEGYSLKLYNPENPGVNFRINLTILPCKLGFYYDEQYQKCTCFSNDPFLICDEGLGTSCITANHWTGTVDGTHVSAPCILGYCRNTHDSCKQCILMDSGPNFCTLQETQSEQCTSLRDNALCAKCKYNNSFTYAAVLCVPNETCDNGYVAIPIIVSLVFTGLTVTLLILILKLDYRISSGYLFCFIYYFSVVGLLLPKSIFLPILIFVSVLQSVTQLNPLFLGYIPICFFQNVDPIFQLAMQYIFPIIVSLLLLTVILSSKYCSGPRFTNFTKFSDNTPVRATCLLILLSFTALTATSFQILNPLSFTGSNYTYVTFQPTIRYLVYPWHAILWVIAMLIELLFVTPFIFLLILSPFLIRRINLTKIKPFLDEFQGCYKDRYRWMAGFYFLCRQVLYMLLLYPAANQFTAIYLFQIACFGVAFFHSLIQPYRSPWLNFADSILLADLVLVSILYGRTAESVLESLPVLQYILTFVLIMIPVVYLTAVLVYICLVRFKILGKRIERLGAAFAPAQQQEQPQTAILPRMAEVQIMDREPLLAILAEDEQLPQEFIIPREHSSSTSSRLRIFNTRLSTNANPPGLSELTRSGDMIDVANDFPAVCYEQMPKHESSFINQD